MGKIAQQAYTIKILEPQADKLKEQAEKEGTMPTTLLQAFVRNTLEANGKLEKSNDTKLLNDYKQAIAENERLQGVCNQQASDLQAAKAALDKQKEALAKVISNAQKSFPITDKQLMKDVVI